MALDESQGIADQAEEVIPDDITQFVEPSALYVGSGGDVTVDLAKGGTEVTFSSVFAGTWMPIIVTRVYDTGTSAANIVRLF